MTYPKALIIDDNESDRALALREIKKLFPQFKYWEIIDETDLKEALQQQKFNLVITDYRLRWTTGLDILYRIKQQRPDCPVIMFTGTGSEEVAVEAMKAGLDDYVIKSPRHYIRLAAAVRSAWQRSQQKQALEKIQQTIELLNRELLAREEAEKLNRIKDEFLATLSHELRTPLNAIIGWMQLIRSGNINESQFAKALNVIDRNAKAQNQLIDDLLDVSCIIRGTIKLQLEPGNLVEVLMASIDTVRPTAEAKKIQIRTQLESEIIKVKIDAERLQQVFWNLLINAVKFTPVGGAITVSAEIPSERVLVKFTDTGQGIAADVLPYVFDRFRQAETKSSTRTKGGLGLGLAIVRHLVEIHGGNVMADSSGLGKGATFSVELPLLTYSPH